MKLRRTTSTDPEFLELVKKLDAELRGRYGEIQDYYEKHNVLATDTVVVASIAGALVGCAAMKPFDAEAVELKRMFVDSAHRGVGIGRLLVAAIEAWAKELGYRAVVLETGDRQPDAVVLYERAGYKRTAKYGPYVELANSLCMRKDLA